MKLSKFTKDVDTQHFRFALVFGVMIIVMLLASTGKSQEPSSQVVWTTSYQEAVRQAEQHDTPILLFFAGSDWCPWCKKLQSEVFDTPDFAAWSADRVVTVIVDFPRGFELPTPLAQQNNALLRQHRQHLNGFPTALFVNADGVVIGKVGYEPEGVLTWIEKAQTFVGKLDKIAQNNLRLPTNIRR